jgi:hypothetical protein
VFFLKLLQLRTYLTNWDSQKLAAAVKYYLYKKGVWGNALKSCEVTEVVF